MVYKLESVLCYWPCTLKLSEWIIMNLQRIKPNQNVVLHDPEREPVTTPVVFIYIK